MWLRFSHVAMILARMVIQLAKEPSQRLLKHVVRCYLRLSDNTRACEALCQCVPDQLKVNKSGIKISHNLPGGSGSFRYGSSLKYKKSRKTTLLLIGLIGRELAKLCNIKRTLFQLNVSNPWNNQTHQLARFLKTYIFLCWVPGINI